MRKIKLQAYLHKHTIAIETIWLQSAKKGVFTGNVNFVLRREQDMNLGLYVCDTNVWFGFSENFRMGK